MLSATITRPSKTFSPKQPSPLVKFFCSLCLFLCFAAPARHSSASDKTYDNILRQELILDVRVRNVRFDIPVLAFEENGQFYLPVVELSRLFEFYVESDPDSGFVSGWYLDESNSYSIDTAKKETVIKGTREPLPEAAVLTDDYSSPGELFIAIEVLNKVWPVEMTVNMAELVLKVETEQKLPFEERKKRETQREAALQRLEARQARKNFPAFPNPYKLYTNPSLHFDSRVEFDDNGYTGTTKLSGAQDFLKTTADWSFVVDASKDQSNTLRDPRLRFRRAETYENELPMGLKDIQVGDITLLQRDRVTGSTRGRGGFISSLPLFNADSFDEKTIEGTGPPGWEVELYRNNQLLDFRTIGEDGFFIFENVEMVFGNNIFKTVLYGPQGQMRESVERVYVGPGQIPQGEVRYRLGVIEQNKELLPGENTGEGINDPEGLSYNAFATYGVTPNLSIFGSASQVQTNQIGDSQYLSTGISLPFLGGAFQTEILKQVDGGQAVDARFISGFMGTSLNIRAGIYDDFESPSNDFGTNAKTFDTRAILTKSLPTGLGLLGLKFDGEYQKREDGSSNSIFRTRQSMSFRRLRLTNETSTFYNDSTHQISQGSFSTSSRLGWWRVRGTLGYDLHPETEIDDMRAEFRYQPPGKSWDAALAFQHNINSKDTLLAAQYTRDYDTFLGSIDAEWNSGDNFSLAFRASMALGAVDKTGYVMSSKPLHARPLIHSQVFLDHNYDGIFNDGDEPLPEVRLEIDDRRTKEETDETGHILTDNAQNLKPVAINVQKKTLTDPYYKSTFDGFTFVPRVGSTPTIPFPIIETGAIDGTVYTPDGQPYAGLKLFLIHADGKFEQETRTAFDGFYTFELIPPGTYLIKAEEGSGITPVEVTLSPGDMFAFGIDLGSAPKPPEKKAESLAPKGGILDTLKEKITGEKPPESAPAYMPGGKPAPTTRDGKFAQHVLRVRIGEHLTKSRFVLDLSGPVSFKTEILQDRHMIIIDFPGVAWNALKEWTAQQTPFLAAYRTEALPGGEGTRLILKMRYAAIPKIVGIVKPGPGRPGTSYGYRFVVDFTSELMKGDLSRPGPTKLAAKLHDIAKLRGVKP